MAGPLRIGLKLWSANTELIPEVLRIHDAGIIHYVELYAVPGTFQDHGSRWQGMTFPVVLHAPHFGAGFNLSLPEKERFNRGLWQDVLRFADHLEPAGLIVHLGTRGTLAESIRQFRLLDAPPCPVWVENKPYLGLDDSLCVGVTPKDIRAVQSACGVGFCFDLAHAMCLAASAGCAHGPLFEAFLALKPDIHHLSDGRIGEPRDQHLHLGEGDYDLPAMIGMLPDGAMISLETPKKSHNSLDHFAVECGLLRQMRARHP